MRLPKAINHTADLAYRVYPSTIESNRKLKAENFQWDLNHPKSLVTLSIEELSRNWRGFPTLKDLVPKDREHFLQVLRTDVPLDILVKHIDSDMFWERCYKAKWKSWPIISEERKWINHYMEQHFAEYLENLSPSNYDPEKITALVNLCSPYIQSLTIRSFIPTDLIVQRNVSPEMEHLVIAKSKTEKVNIHTLHRDHISLHAALGSLTNLVEIHITFQLRNVGVDYRKDQFKFTQNDARNLSRGLEKCSQLRIVRITRTDMDCQKLKYILRAITDLRFLETIDVSHCKVGDEGASHIAKFISKRESIRNVILTDNLFGPHGAECLANALSHSLCGVRMLDLRLNSKLGSEGISHIAVTIGRGCNLTSLNISGCGIKSGPLSKVPIGVWSTTSAETNPTCGELLARAIGLAKTPLRSLDISVNDIGSPSDTALANAICLSYIVDVYLKRSGMSSSSMAIAEAAAASQRLRREAEKGIRFKRSAGRVVQARRVVKGMNIDADPMLFAQQLSARPSIVSVTSEEGTYSIQTQPLPMEFGFVPALKELSPLMSSRASSVTGPPTSRRSSHHIIMEPVMEMRRSALVRRRSDGSLLQARNNTEPRHIKIFVSNDHEDRKYFGR